MPNYHRVRIEGATYFLTLVTFDRTPFLTTPRAREIFRGAWQNVKKRHPFTTDAICLLPDHLHILITLPEDDADYSMRIREIKRLFTRRYGSTATPSAQRNQSRIQKKEAAIWQRRFWEHTIRDERDYQNHFDYIHFNPVKHGLVKNVALWPWSSFHRYLRLGVYQQDWGTDYDVNPK